MDEVITNKTYIDRLNGRSGGNWKKVEMDQLPSGHPGALSKIEPFHKYSLTATR